MRGLRQKEDVMLAGGSCGWKTTATGQYSIRASGKLLFLYKMKHFPLEKFGGIEKKR